VKKAVSTVVTAAVTVATAVAQVVVPIVKPAILAGYQVVCILGGSELATKIGAAVLRMSPDTAGIYHADFNCWQQIFGYMDLYDIVFDLTTSMDHGKFAFLDEDSDGLEDYIFWAWKGDYINLGAGAELGIYKRWDSVPDIWIVDKDLAMKMSLKLVYKGTTIIDWQSDKEWWITGFNPKLEYYYANQSNLKATYTVTFTNTTMYNALKNSITSKDPTGWTFNGMTPTFVF
jgi:hypothetical protein